MGRGEAASERGEAHSARSAEASNYEFCKEGKLATSVCAAVAGAAGGSKCSRRVV